MSRYVYEWREDSDRYCVVAGIDSPESKGLSAFTGLEFCLSLRRPLRLRPIYDERGALPLSDFPYYSTQPKILSERAWSALADMLEPCGRSFAAEIIDVGLNYRVWFPTVVTDCLLEDQSEFFESLSGFRKILKPAFLGSSVPEKGPFTVAGFEKQQVWVPKRFAEAARKNGLVGALFNKRGVVVSEATANYAFKRTAGRNFDVS